MKSWTSFFLFFLNLEMVLSPECFAVPEILGLKRVFVWFSQLEIFPLCRLNINLFSLKISSSARLCVSDTLQLMELADHHTEASGWAARGTAHDLIMATFHISFSFSLNIRSLSLIHVLGLLRFVLRTSVCILTISCSPVQTLLMITWRDSRFTCWWIIFLYQVLFSFSWTFSVDPVSLLNSCWHLYESKSC